VIERIADSFDFGPQFRQVHDHPRPAIGQTSNCNFGEVGVSMYSPATVCFEVSFQSVGGLEHEALT
jgi:hypothetical protein